MNSRFSADLTAKRLLPVAGYPPDVEVFFRRIARMSAKLLNQRRIGQQRFYLCNQPIDVGARKTGDPTGINPGFGPYSWSMNYTAQAIAGRRGKPDLRHPTFDLFIFDFDGTLVDSRRNVANGVNFALADRGLQAVEAGRIYPLIGKLTLEETFKYFCPQFETPEIDVLIQTFRQYQRVHTQSEITFFPEALSTLQALRERNKQLAILSTKYVEQLEFTLDLFGVRDLFHTVCGLGSLPQLKPARASVEFVWRCLDIENGQQGSVMIGDSEVDVATAKNAGIPMIAVGHGVDSLEYLTEKGATYTIRSLSELLCFA